MDALNQSERVTLRDLIARCGGAVPTVEVPDVLSELRLRIELLASNMAPAQPSPFALAGMTDEEKAIVEPIMRRLATAAEADCRDPTTAPEAAPDAQLAPEAPVTAPDPLSRTTANTIGGKQPPPDIAGMPPRAGAVHAEDHLLALSGPAEGEVVGDYRDPSSDFGPVPVRGFWIPEN
jgi:hypothetical protein